MKIIDANNIDAKKYFLNEDAYFTFSLPPYLKFQDILNECDILLKHNNIEDYYKINKENNRKENPRNFDNVNFDYIINKDKDYQWRKLQIIHPLLYVNLINIITKKDNWEELQARYKALTKNFKIISCAMPIYETKIKKETDINNWWTEFEQRIIAENLNYSFMGVTDITNCYSSIYTHSISWAIKGKGYCKENRNGTYLCNKIDKLIQEMQYGQTNGIPQGSKIMDFISEFVLAYADYKISKKLENNKIYDYKILRYRDDYRIFSNNKIELEKIIRIISDVLRELNLMLNANKTYITDDIIGNSIKKDKLNLICGDINLNNNLQKSLFVIWKFGRENPNSGSIIHLLKKIYIKIDKAGKQYDNLDQLVSLLTELMIDNPKIQSNIISIISLLFKKQVDKNIQQCIDKIIEKFDSKVKTDNLEIWLQRLSILENRKKNYDSKLCKVVSGDLDSIWNSDFLNFKFKSSIVNETILNKLSPAISKSEVFIFNDYYLF